MQKLFHSILKRKNLLMVIQLMLIITGIIARFILDKQSLFNLTFLTASIIGIIPILIQAIFSLKVKVVSIDVLVAIAAIGAFIIQNYEEAAIVTFLFIFGAWLEGKTLDCTRSSIKSLIDMAPVTAWVKQEDSNFKETDLDYVKVGDIIQVKTGGQIPVDGTIISGTGYLNESSITGESMPIKKTLNEKVFAGSLLENGTLYLKTEHVGEDTTFGKIIELIEEAQDSKSDTEKFIDRFSRYYTPIVLLLGIIVGLITKNVELAITILVLGCPGALVIGVPVSNVAGIGNGAKNGVLLKGSETIKKFSKVDTMIFDKTGTLTYGEAKVVDMKYYGLKSEKDLIYLSAIEKESHHPLGQAIIKHLDIKEASPAISFNEVIKGGGIIASIEGNLIAVGNLYLMKKLGYTLTDQMIEDINHFESNGNSIVLTAINSEIKILLGIRDQLRQGIKESFIELKKQGVKNLFVASGDNQGTVNMLAKELGLTEAKGNMLPEDKSNYVKQLIKDGHIVAFIGDGINDSPSLASADIGIAMGSGTDTAIETSDVVLVRSEFEQLNYAFGLSRKTHKNIKQNIMIALAVVFILIVMLLFTPWMNMTIGMLIHEGSILAVIINAMRLLKYNQ